MTTPFFHPGNDALGTGVAAALQAETGELNCAAFRVGEGVPSRDFAATLRDRSLFLRG